MGDFNDQFPNLSRLPLSALGILGFLARILFPAPAIERRRRDQCDQFLDRTAQGFAELEKPPPFIGPGVNLAWDATAEDFVLFLQKLDLLRQLAIGSRRNQCQQRVENSGHRGIF